MKLYPISFLFFSAPLIAGTLKLQNFEASLFASGSESSPTHFSGTAPVVHASSGGTDLGFSHNGLISTSGGTAGIDVAAGVVDGEFRIMHYSSNHSGSSVDFGNPRVGALHFNTVSFPEGSTAKSFSMDIRDIGTNTNDDDVLVRLLVNGGNEVTLLDTRSQTDGTAGSQTLTHNFADSDTSAQLLIDILSDDNGDGYGIDNIEFLATTNPNAPSFNASPIVGAPARATLSYTGSLSGTANDPNGDTLIFSKESGPGWLVVASDGSLSGTPGIEHFGMNAFTVKVSDASDGSDTAVLQIQVNDEDGNTPPVLADANTTQHRLIWVQDPSTTVTVAWKQVSGANAVVHYGPEDAGRYDQFYPSSKTVDRVGVYSGGGTIETCFARLSGLSPDTAYYFVLKDDAGVSERYWFRTAPDTPKPFSFIAGGDSRNNRTPRQQANRLVGKLRPLFVAFTGDMINSDNAGEWNDWLDDWEQTISADGRLYPILPHRGNHESGGDSTVYNLFDTTSSNYYALSFGGQLLRYYVLNSESNESAQGSWIQTDLDANGGMHAFTHLVAGYHKPMRPHVSSKSEGSTEYAQWANRFYDNRFDLILESDSHTMKRTAPIYPSGSGDEGFAVSEANGAVYIGEGCWGAPLRSADDNKSWTLDSGRFNGFDVIYVYRDYLEVVTVEVDTESSVKALEKDDLFSLPEGIKLWEASSGTRLVINRGAPEKLSYIQYQMDTFSPNTPGPNTQAFKDYDGDGLSNLMEYVFYTDAKQPDYAEVGSHGGASYDVLAGEEKVVSFRRRANITTTFNYYVSTDLVSWRAMIDGIDYDQAIQAGSGYEDVELSLKGALAAEDRVFFRIGYSE